MRWSDVNDRHCEVAPGYSWPERASEGGSSASVLQRATGKGATERETKDEGRLLYCFSSLKLQHLQWLGVLSAFLCLRVVDPMAQDSLVNFYQKKGRGRPATADHAHTVLSSPPLPLHLRLLGPACRLLLGRLKKKQTHARNAGVILYFLL